MLGFQGRYCFKSPIRYIFLLLLLLFSKTKNFFCIQVKADWGLADKRENHLLGGEQTTGVLNAKKTVA